MVAITYSQLPKSVKKGQRILVQVPQFAEISKLILDMIYSLA